MVDDRIAAPGGAVAILDGDDDVAVYANGAFGKGAVRFAVDQRARVNERVGLGGGGACKQGGEE